MNNLSRRFFVTGTVAATALTGLLPGAAVALSAAEARGLVDRVVADINKVIASGKSQNAMIADFENIFRRYADVNTIARSTLGADARRASRSQLNAYTSAFRGYISRKYGKRFREFIGGRIDVDGVREVKWWHEVITTANLKGQSPFEVLFLVSDKSGKNLFFDMKIEGISLLVSERTEIGAMLDRRRGDIDMLIADLKTAG